MADNPFPADIQSGMEAIAMLTAQVMTISTQVQYLAAAVGKNATAAITVFAFVITQGQLMV